MVELIGRYHWKFTFPKVLYRLWMKAKTVR
jgi:hypothetical protein